MADLEQVIDGSQGGGQLLRSALALSLITGRPFRLERFREHRSTPGLRPQHLACLRGVQAISDSQVQGAEMGSAQLRFVPGPVRSGEYVLDVGTAGSTSLVLQCLAYPMALAGGGTLTLRGGTHVPRSPSYHYLAWVWRPALLALGLEVRLGLRHAGFHPEGGGELRAEIAPWRSGPTRLDLPSRGTLSSAVVTSLFGGIPFGVAQKQAAAAAQALKEHGILCEEEHLPLPTSRSAGSELFIRLQFEHTAAGFTEVGERQLAPEAVGRAAAAQVAAFMEGAGAVEEHLADQLLLPASLLAAARLGEAAVARFRSARITEHMTQSARVIEQLLPVRLELTSGGEVEVRPSVV